MQDFVEIVEVGARDGLQSQPTLLDTDTKLEFIRRLVAAGHTRLEVASFVNPQRVPQMADAEELVRRLPRVEGVHYIGLVLNQRGFERAMAAGMEQLNCADVASETFCRRNQGTTPEAMYGTIRELAREARAAGTFFGVTIATAFGCPFEGPTDPALVADMAAKYADLGVNEIALADTIGVAVPTAVRALIARVRPRIGDIPLRMHFHNTRNTGIANVYAAVEEGVRIFDASCGGLGGCPFAPGATGNVGTEDVLYLLHGMGLRTAARLPDIIETTHWLEGPLGGRLPAMVSRANAYPPTTS